MEECAEMGMMSKDWDGLSKLCDTFFNGRKATEEKSKQAITVRDLVTRRVSVVRCDGKMYRITVEDYEVGK